MEKIVVFMLGVSAATYCFAMQKQPVAMRVCLLRHRPVAMRIDAQPTPRKERWISTKTRDLPNLEDEIWISYYNELAHWFFKLPANYEGATKFVMTDFQTVQYPFWIKKLKCLFYEHSDWPWKDTTIHFKIYNDTGDSAIYTSPPIEAQHYPDPTEFNLGVDSVKIESGNFWVAFDPVAPETPTAITDSNGVRERSYTGTVGNWHILMPEGQDSAWAEWSIYAYVSWTVGIEETVPGKAGFEVKCPPNPIQSLVSIAYTLPAKMHVNIGVYDITGRLLITLEDKIKSRGEHEAKLNPAELVSGIYFCKFEAGEFNSTKKLVLLK